MSTLAALPSVHSAWEVSTTKSWYQSSMHMVFGF